jgi:hypothetical protein
VAAGDSPGVAELEAAGLYDRNAADASQHLALLEYLIELGVSVDEMLAVPAVELPSAWARSRGRPRCWSIS